MPSSRGRSTAGAGPRPLCPLGRLTSLPPDPTRRREAAASTPRRQPRPRRAGPPSPLRPRWAPAPPTATRNAVTGTRARRTAIDPPTRSRVTGDRRSISPRMTACASHGSIGSTPLHAAAYAVQPVTSPIATAAARPTGGHAISAWPRRRTGSSAGPPIHARETGPTPPGVAPSRQASPGRGRALAASGRGARVAAVPMPTPAAACGVPAPGWAAPAHAAARCRRAVAAPADVEDAPDAATAGSSSVSPCVSVSVAGRRARCWYSGPCLRGSAYSRGLTIQYSPLEGPYHEAPLQVGSLTSRASSYEVEPIVALRVARRLPPAPPEAVPDVPDAPDVPDRPARPAPWPEAPVPLEAPPAAALRADFARSRAALARAGSARHGSAGGGVGARCVLGPVTTRPVRNCS